MEGIKVTDYKGMRCANVSDDKYLIQTSTMCMALCEKCDTGMKVLEADIVGGIMMRSDDDFAKCVQWYIKDNK